MKLDWLSFWVSAVACYRLTILISRCLGPFGIFKRARSIQFSSKLLSCPFCVSIYTGALTAFILWLSGFVMPIPMWILLALSFSAVTIAMDRTFTADYET